MFIVIVLLGAGLALLLGGAEWLVRGSSRLAFALGVSPLVIGLTIVAFGTSAPELATSLSAAYHGRGDIALGNVIGSNIVNIGLVLGLAGLLIPIRVESAFNNRLIPFLLVISITLWFFGRELHISRFEGMIFLGLMAVYIWYSLKVAGPSPGVKKTAVRRHEERPTGRNGPLLLYVFLVATGLVMLAAGSELFVRGAVQFAQLVGISEAVVGVTVVALGTSLPELVVSVLAGVKRMPSVALGNIVGSNVFNILTITGLSAAAFPFSVSASLVNLSLPVMIGFTVFLMIICFTRKQVSRIEAASALLFIVLYAVGLLRYS